MSQNSKQNYIGRSVEGGTDTKYDQTAVSAATAAALQQSLALSPSQLQFMQAAAAAAASPQSMQLSLPWMLPQYQMMVLPEGMQQSLMGGQSLVQLPDGRVILAPVSEDGSTAGQTMSTEDVATAEALLRQQLQRQQQALAATSNSVQQQQQQQQLLYQQQLQAHQLQQQQQQHNAAVMSATSMSQQNYVQQQQAQQSVAKIQSGSAENSRPDLPPQPKKPLTPYMMFSKAIWPQVKAANTHLSSVCEIGAVIGSLWRDLDPTEKQKYNDQFVREKERYDTELRAYLKSTGLHASDLVKVKAKRNNVRSSVNSMPHLNPVSVGTTLAGNLHPTLSNPVTQGMITSTPFTGHPANTQRQNIPATFTTGQQQQLLEAQISLLQGQSHNNTSSQQAAGVSQAKADVPSQMWQIGSGGSVNPLTNDSGSEQAALQAQVLQLREALSERTNEVLKLSQTLDEAQKTIELYKTQLAAVSIDATTYPSNSIINNTHSITVTSESSAASTVEAISDNSGNIVSDASGSLLPVTDRFENDGEAHDTNVEIKAVEGGSVKNSEEGQPDGGKYIESTAPELIVKNGETKAQNCSFDGKTLLENDLKEENKVENRDCSSDVKLSALSDGSELELPKAVLQDDP